MGRGATGVKGRADRVVRSVARVTRALARRRANREVASPLSRSRRTGRRREIPIDIGRSGWVSSRAFTDPKAPTACPRDRVTSPTNRQAETASRSRIDRSKISRAAPVRIGRHEADISAEPHQALANPWFSRADEDQGRASRVERAPSQGSETHQRSHFLQVGPGDDVGRWGAPLSARPAPARFA